MDQLGGGRRQRRPELPRVRPDGAGARPLLTAYAQIREWVVLAGGVVGATLVVPEFLYDVTDGSLGASGVMLVAGVTLLAGSLAGLRIRRNPDPTARTTP